MKPLKELHDFIASKLRVKINQSKSDLLDFTVNHRGGISRKDLMNKILEFSGYKLKSTGKNSGIKNYIVFKQA